MGKMKSGHLKELRAWMKRTNTKQIRLAHITGLSEPSISLILKGERHFTIDTAEMLADLTEIPVEKLLTGADAMRLLKLLGSRQNSSSGNDRGKSNVA